MCMSRSYVPVYDNTEEDYTSKVKKELKKDIYHETKNPQPYNQLNKNWGVAIVYDIEDVDHITIFYNIFSDKLVHRYVNLSLDWYMAQEAADDHKSVQVPHLHFIKILNPWNWKSL